ncbi:MAG: ankyrin repeat domain-containing protein [Legionella sp.]|jgi:ankyrin repeat protein
MIHFKSIAAKDPRSQAYQAICAEPSIIRLVLTPSLKSQLASIELTVFPKGQQPIQTRILIQKGEISKNNALAINNFNLVVTNSKSSPYLTDRKIGLELQELAVNFCKQEEKADAHAIKISELCDAKIYINPRTLEIEKDEEPPKNKSFQLESMTPAQAVKYEHVFAAAINLDVAGLRKIVYPNGSTALKFEQAVADTILPFVFDNWNQNTSVALLKEVLALLIAAGADYKTYFLSGSATQEIMQRLISCGADIDVQFQGYTALHRAVIKVDKSLMHFLISNGANINTREYLDDFGSPLHICIANEKFDEALFMIDVAAKSKYPCDFTVRDFEEKTALIIAAKTRASALVKKICTIDKSCVNLQDNQGRTALHYACVLGDVDSVRALIAAGANVSIQDKKGNTPAHFASSGSTHIKEVLESIYIDSQRDSGAPSNAISDSKGIVTLRKSLAKEDYSNIKTTELTIKTTNKKLFSEILFCAENKAPLIELCKNCSILDRQLLAEQLSKLSNKSLEQVCLEGQPRVLSLLLKEHNPLSWWFKNLSNSDEPINPLGADGQPTGNINFYIESMKPSFKVLFWGPAKVPAAEAQNEADHTFKKQI